MTEITVTIPDRLIDAITALAESNHVLARAIEQRAVATAHGVTLREAPRQPTGKSMAGAMLAARDNPLRTPERDALMRAEWPGGVNVRGIVLRFNALPGKKAKTGRIAVIASEMKLRRPEGYDFQTAPMTLAEAQTGLTQPEPVPVTRYGRPASVWTPERNTVLRRDYPAGVGRDLIIAALNDLPGPVITVMAMKARVKLERLARPVDARWMPPAALAMPAPPKVEPEAAPAPVEPPPVATAPEPVPAPPSSRMDIIRQVAASLPQKPPPMPRPAMPECIRMDADQLRGWAATRGIALNGSITEEDIAACNAKARAVNHPRIEFVSARRP